MESMNFNNAIILYTEAYQANKLQPACMALSTVVNIIDESPNVISDVNKRLTLRYCLDLPLLYRNSGNIKQSSYWLTQAINRLQIIQDEEIKQIIYIRCVFFAEYYEKICQNVKTDVNILSYLHWSDCAKQFYVRTYADIISDTAGWLWKTIKAGGELLVENKEAIKTVVTTRMELKDAGFSGSNDDKISNKSLELSRGGTNNKQPTTTLKYLNIDNKSNTNYERNLNIYNKIDSLFVKYIY